MHLFFSLSGLSTRQHTNTKLLLESAAYNLFCPRKAQDCSRATFCCADERVHIFIRRAGRAEKYTAPNVSASGALHTSCGANEKRRKATEPVTHTHGISPSWCEIGVLSFLVNSRDCSFCTCARRFDDNCAISSASDNSVE